MAMLSIFTEWLTPFCTVLSLIISIITICESNRLNRQQFKLNQQTYKEKIQSQANKVAIWRISSENKRFQMEDIYYLPVYFIAANNSTLPIYEILVIDVSSQPEVDLNILKQMYSVSPNVEYSGAQDYFSYMQTLPPGDIIGVVRGHGSGMGKTDDLVYFFKDTSGKRWFRNNRGKLFLIDNDDQYYTLINSIGIMASDLLTQENFNSKYIKNVSTNTESNQS